MVRVDEVAREIAATQWALPPCLHIPIAARDEAAIRDHIGNVSTVLAPGRPNKALLVEIPKRPEIDDTLAIWRLPEAAILHSPKQIWVHVDFSGYRDTYLRTSAVPDLTGLVLDHVMNRRVARLKGFLYLRIGPSSGEENSSRGGLSEKWAASYHGTLEMRERNRNSAARVQHADLADIVKMLNIRTGGVLQVPVNEAQALLKKA